MLIAISILIAISTLDASPDLLLLVEGGDLLVLGDGSLDAWTAR